MEVVITSIYFITAGLWAIEDLEEASIESYIWLIIKIIGFPYFVLKEKRE